MGRNRNKHKGGLGNALIKQKNKQNYKEHEHFIKEGQEIKEYKTKQKLESCIVRDPLNEFLYEAELAHKKFEGIRNTKIIPNETKVIVKSNNYKARSDLKNRDEILEKVQFLRIPRRPDWKDKTIEQQKEQENQDFITWRKELGKLEENFPTAVLTPYEKNIEVWKQLWRTVEKSDVVVQIVDCRDPLFYYCKDIIQYTQELSKQKQNFLILNKADLLPKKVIKILSNFLNEKKIQHIFFSAKDEQKKIDDTPEQEEDKLIQQKDKIDEEIKHIEINTENLINREELLQIFKQFLQEKLKMQIGTKFIEPTKEKPELITIGMVGYPNVGKSSLINVLCGKKMVGVDKKPGKTKNFQTIYLNKDIMLCDCPGLVFPSIVSSKSEMICNGVLSLSQLVQYLAPVQYVLFKSSLNLIARMYKLPIEVIDLSKNNSEQEYSKKSREILQAFAGTRGYLTGAGLPDEAKAARIILEDYVTGKIIHFNLPKEYENQREQILEEYIKEIYPEHLKIPYKNIKKEDLLQNQHIDKDYLNKQQINKDKIRNESQLFFDNLTEDMMMQLIQGQRVMGKKLSKGQRRELKFVFKSDEISENKILNLLNSFLFNAKAKNDLQFAKK